MVAEARPEMQANLFCVRTIDDHEWGDAVHRALDAAHVQFVAQYEGEGTEHHREILGFASRHERVYRHGSNRRHFQCGRDVAYDFLGTALRSREHPLDTLLCGRHHGKAVRPRFVEEEFEFVDLVSHVDDLRSEVGRGRASGQTRIFAMIPLNERWHNQTHGSANHLGGESDGGRLETDTARSDW